MKLIILALISLSAPAALLLDVAADGPAFCLTQANSYRSGMVGEGTPSVKLTSYADYNFARVGTSSHCAVKLFGTLFTYGPERPGFLDYSIYLDSTGRPAPSSAAMVNGYLVGASSARSVSGTIPVVLGSSFDVAVYANASIISRPPSYSFEGGGSLAQLTIYAYEAQDRIKFYVPIFQLAYVPEPATFGLAALALAALAWRRSAKL